MFILFQTKNRSQQNHTLVLCVNGVFQPHFIHPGGGGTPLYGYIGMCGPKGYGFQPFWS